MNKFYMRLIKIYHITFIMCAPYFVKNTFQLKRYYSLFIYIYSKRAEKVISSYQIYSVAISTLLFDSSNHK